MFAGRSSVVFRIIKSFSAAVVFARNRRKLFGGRQFRIKFDGVIEFFVECFYATFDLSFLVRIEFDLTSRTIQFVAHTGKRRSVAVKP